MTTITFDTGLVNGSVSLVGNIVYGTEWFEKRYNQSTVRLATGELRTYDSGLNIVEGVISIKNVSRDNGNAFNEWVRDYAIFQFRPFTITVPAGVDLGNGLGVNILNARLTASDTKKIAKFVVPEKFQFKIPYTYRRP